MDKPLVTVGLTCYNAESTVGRAIDSAMAQDWPHFEVLIVDDFSSDDSVTVIESIASSDPRLRLLRHKRNMGTASARNTLLNEAKGEFIIFFDDDDVSYPNRISTQLKTITDYEQHTGALLVACYAGGVRRYPNGYTKDLPAIGSQGVAVPQGPGLADYLLFYRKQVEWFYGSGVPACALMARLSTFRTLGGFDDKMRRVEDADFAIRLALQGGHFIGTQDELFVQYSTDAADKSPERNLESEQRLVLKNKSYLKSLGRFYYAYRWPKLRYWHFLRRYDRFVMELLELLLHNPAEVFSHLLKTGPKRLLHEFRMRRK